MSSATVQRQQKGKALGEYLAVVPAHRGLQEGWMEGMKEPVADWQTRSPGHFSTDFH